MRVFLTGATGWVGAAVLPELLASGHEVLGLARSDEGAERLAKAGVPIHRGDLTDPGSFAAGARACEGVIHTAFDHDFSQFAANIENERRAVEAMLDALAGSEKPLVISSGVALLAPGKVATEADRQATQGPAAGRALTEELVVAAAVRGVRTSVVRLAPTVHGAGDHGFVPRIVAAAREHGVAAYVGDGANRWPAVHRLDAARLYRLALESAAPGSRLHAIAEEGVPMRVIAETIGEGLRLPTRSLTPEEAPAHFGFMAMFVGLDIPASSQITRDALGWRPQGPDLLTDLRENGYLD
jgi:nucleoside-diphosphate-sugar epimerase